MQAKFNFIVEITDDNVNSTFSAEKIEDMDIARSMALLKLFNDQQKRIKNLLFRESSNNAQSLPADKDNDSQENSTDDDMKPFTIE